MGSSIINLMNKLLSFTEMCENDGKTASTEMVSLEWTSASVSISQYLHINEKDRVLKIIRIRKSDKEPVMLEEGYFPSKYSYLMEAPQPTKQTEVMFGCSALIAETISLTVIICTSKNKFA